MIARECDRCKTLFKPEEIYDGHKMVFNDVLIRKVTNAHVLENVYEMDLCPECHKDLITWLFGDRAILVKEKKE